jgi:hypothetical protein
MPGMAGCGGGAWAADRLDGEFNIHWAGLLEDQRALDALPLDQRLFEAEQHDMEGAGLEFDRLARLDLQAALHGPHLGDAVVHDQAVDLEAGGHRGRAADQAVGLGALVLDGKVGAGDIEPLGGRPRPGVVNLKGTDGVVPGRCRRRPFGEDERTGEERG